MLAWPDRRRRRRIRSNAPDRGARRPAGIVPFPRENCFSREENCACEIRGGARGVWRNRSLPVASHAAARVPIRIERRAFPSLSIPDTRERCERRARLETLTRAITQIWPLSTLVIPKRNSSRLRGCVTFGVYSQSDSSPVPIGDSRRPNGTSSTPHRIGEISPNRNIRMGILCV